MFSKLIGTETDYLYTFLRIIAGIIIFPYGMQKLFGWFGGPGIKGTLLELREKKIPIVIAWLIIIGQSFGSIALITGFLTRIAAVGIFIIMAGAMITRLKYGWTMNWFGTKKGEGVEYFVMLLALLLSIIIRGGGGFSVDRLMMDYIF